VTALRLLAVRTVRAVRAVLAGADTADERLDRLEARASCVVVGLAEGDTGGLRHP